MLFVEVRRVRSRPEVEVQLELRQMMPCGASSSITLYRDLERAGADGSNLETAVFCVLSTKASLVLMSSWGD